MTLGIAIVGTGSIVEYHAGALARLPEAALRCLVGRDAAKARAVAARLGIAEAGDDYAGVLQRDDVQAIVIATPDDTHETLAMRAIDAGKHVMVQKPLAADEAACRRLIEAADRARVDLQTSFMHRHFPEVGRARERLAAGAIGALRSARLRNATPGPDWAGWFFRKDGNPGGVVQQLGVHGIDLLLWLIGPIVEVRAATAILRPERKLANGRSVAVEVPDTAFAIYRFAGGAMAAHDMSMIEAAGCDRFRLEFYGDEGTIVLRGELGPLAIRRRGELSWTTPALAPEAPGLGHHRLWIDGLLGRAPRQKTADDARAGMAVAQAIFASAIDGGRAVSVARPSEGDD